MTGEVGIIGFGEAGMALAPVGARAFDLRDDAAKRADFERCGVIAAQSARDALRGADAIMSLVTADQALAAARTYADFLKPGALWFDMNSVAPATKREAAVAVKATGALYVDVAIMAPVAGKRRGVPLLVAGPHTGAAIAVLSALGFTSIAQLDGDIGAAAAVKMIRSVMIKGIEALSAECALAADAAGVVEAVIGSLDATDEDTDWRARFDYNLDRMLVHGTRRAAEMREVVVTLDGFGAGAGMARATLARQSDLGSLDLDPPPGLDAKLAAIRRSLVAAVAS